MNQSNPADARRWAPRVADGPTPYYRRLADALQDAVTRGALPVGSRLPTQRALAKTLSISVGTANSAYLEAERRGLIRRHVGRGTFVASPGTRSAAPDGQINLAINLPPFHRAAPLIRTLLAQLIEDADTTELLGYPLFSEGGRYVSAVAGWISRTSALGALMPQQIVPCQGATQGLLACLDLLRQRSPAVMCEQITYGGFKVVAKQLGLQLVPVAIDAEGMTPEGLDAAARTSAAKTVLLCPNLHNPTGAVAGTRRRREWIEIARRHELNIIEDDVYGGLGANEGLPPPLAALDPQRVFYVGSASKAIAPGLRAGWVVPPTEHRDALASILHARTAAMAPFGCPVLTAGAAPFGFLAFAKLCETRMADEIAGIIKLDTEERQRLARRVLGRHIHLPCAARSPHVWLPMDALQAETLHQSLAQQQIHVTAPTAPMVDAAPSGLRVCLGGPERIEQLEEALTVIAGELEHNGLSTAAWRP